MAQLQVPLPPCLTGWKLFLTCLNWAGKSLGEERNRKKKKKNLKSK